MASLLLGPLLRHSGETDATIWVETDDRCTVSVNGARADTFCVFGHHYALVHITGLERGTCTPYEVALDGETVWPPADYDWPAPVLRTLDAEEPIDVVFGSCRVSYPHEEPWTLTKDEDDDGREICALRSYAFRMRDLPPEEWPGALLMLGDQIYADEVAPETIEFIRSRRDTSIPPGEEVADYEEYAHLYRVAWTDPPMRWLLSTVASAMIFDDHDVHDDWNTSHVWVEKARAQGWWDERIVGAFSSYWVYQHIGNLEPDALEADDVWRALHRTEDGGEILREFAWQADRRVDSTQWSYVRDIGPARLLMIDSRAGRVLDPENRSMVDEAEWDFIESNGGDGHAHLLLGTSLPWLLAPGMHHMEAWNEALSEGAWGRSLSRVGEVLREAVDFEHWAAFQASFERLTEHVRRIGKGECGPVPDTIVALSGDVHHAYLAEVAFRRGSGVKSRVYQAVCSPFRNPLDQRERRAIRFAMSKPATMFTRALARAAGVEDPSIRWRLVPPAPFFDNVVATLQLHGRDARLVIRRARPTDDGGARLEDVFEQTL